MKFKMKLTPESVARALLVSAAGICVYLTVLAFSSSGQLAGCGEGAACSNVMNSTWAKVFGVPVAVLGGITYLVAAFVPASSQLWRRVLLATIPLAALWFLGVQLFAVGTFCPWCCAAHLLASTGAVTLLISRRDEYVRNWVPSMAGALAAVAAFGLVQIAFSGSEQTASDPEKMVEVYELGGGSPAESDQYVNEVTLLDGKVAFRLDEMPLVGVAQPQHVVFSLTDYTCPHCRKLNDLLQNVGVSLGGQVAILKLPATRKGTDSAKIHRHMLALWKVDPKMHWTLERSLIEGRVQPSSAAVEAEAIRLVGGSRFAEANVRHNAWISELLAKTRKVQNANREKTGKATLPQVIIGTELVMGAHSDPAFYLGKAEQQFGLVAEKSQDAAPPVSRQIVLERDGAVRLGEVAPGAIIPFKVAFENRSRRPMEVSWLNLGAGLASKKFTREEIWKDKGVLELELEVPQDARPGQLVRTVTINSSTGQEPMTFRVEAEIGASVANVSTPVE